VSWYQKGKTKLDFTEARDSEWQSHQMSHMQICTSPRRITTPTSYQFLQARRPSCYLTNSIKALRQITRNMTQNHLQLHVSTFVVKGSFEVKTELESTGDVK